MGAKRHIDGTVEGSYGTVSEIRFIQGLPNHVNRGMQKFTRLQLLKKYLENAKRRHYWEYIDKRKVIGHVLGEIAALERKGADRGRV